MKSTDELKKNRVIVRVWTSMANPIDKGEDVGHISIQTKDKYMSLWPKQVNDGSAEDQEGKGITKGVTHELLLNYDVDRSYEGRDPEVVICFYTLDKNKLEAKFHEFQGRLKGWNVFGICRDCESCASFAWELLQAGGIRKLVSHVKESSVISKGAVVGSGVSSQQSLGSFSQEHEQHEEKEKGILDNSSIQGSLFLSEMGVSPMIKSPDALANILKEAKQEELTKHIETRDIEKYPGETIILPRGSKGCSIM